MNDIQSSSKWVGIYAAISIGGLVIGLISTISYGVTLSKQAKKYKQEGNPDWKASANNAAFTFFIALVLFVILFSVIRIFMIMSFLTKEAISKIESSF